MNDHGEVFFSHPKLQWKQVPVLLLEERRCPNCGADLREYVETEQELAAAAQECRALDDWRRE